MDKETFDLDLIVSEIMLKTRFLWFYAILYLTLPVLFNANDAPRRQDKKAKAVTTLLNAKWSIAPIVLEIAEYLAEENPDHLWRFIEHINALTTPLVNLKTEREQYDMAISVASKLLSPARMKTLKLGLSLHINSPMVEMFAQMALERGVDSKGCVAVVDIANELICSPDEVENTIKETSYSYVDTFQVDHHYPGSMNNSVSAVLYGELGSREFAVLHSVLSKYAEKGKVNYVVRWYIKDRSQRRLRLSGYGVELQLKSTEYKSQDDTAPNSETANAESEMSSEELDENDPQSQIEGFNFARLKNLFPDMRTSLEKFRKHLAEQESELAPLKVWQFQALSLQAAESIMSAPLHEALLHFTSIAQNFPMQANSLVRTAVSPQLKEDIKNNQELFASTLNVHPTDTALFINGMFFDMDIVDIITLLQTLRQELTTMEGLHSLGLSNERMSRLLSLDLTQGQNQGYSSMMSTASVNFALDIRDTGILWINDLERDTHYKRWSTSYTELLRPTYPGVLRNIRRNLYNLVLIFDPLDVSSRSIVKLAESFIRLSAPVRVGIAMKVSANTDVHGLKDAGVAMLFAFNYLSQEKSARDAFEFIIYLYDYVKENDITIADVKKKLRDAGGFGTDVDDILGEDSGYDFGREVTKEFFLKTGMQTLPQVLMNGIPLAKEDLDADHFEEGVLTEIMQQTSKLQKAVFRGELTDHDNIMDYLMEQPHVMPRLNQRILTMDPAQYLDMTGTASSDFGPDNLLDLIKLSNNDMSATAIKYLKYFEKKSQNAEKPERDIFVNTIWVVGDLNCPKSRKILKYAIEYMKYTKGVRVTFLPNIDGDSKIDQSLNKVVVAALNVLSTKEALDYVSKLLADEGCHEMKNCDILPELVPALNKQDWLLKASRVYVSRVLGFKKASQSGIVFDGRILGPFRDDETFDEDDFLLLERFSNQIYGDKIRKVLIIGNKDSENDIIDDIDKDEDLQKLSANSVLKLISLLLSKPQTKARFSMPSGLKDTNSVVSLPAMDENLAAFDIVAIVDPVSRGAQKIGPILITLQQVLNCRIKVYLNSIEKSSDMPLKSFYRFVLEPELLWNSDGSLNSGPHARFTHLPQSSLLTQSLHVPGNWLVESVRSVYDLDNIRLADVEKVVHSEFELEYLLLEGHCWDATAGTPPRGLQITLGTKSNPTQVDTIVMANLGYFQLKANPGAWILRLRQGRSADIYDIVSHEGSDTPPNSTDIKVVISSLRSHVLKLRVTKKADKQNVDLLSDSNESNGGIWNSITSSFAGNEVMDKEDEKINIFSLASGHLYERFLRIMMLSVLKHTKTPVKFWFLKNYLSPSLKDILPYMAKEYGFEYELVEYKWPRWLHQQTEKQRIIWGYKILFLDVLFPLDVKKIIFVDADQIVRADMKELVDLDLGGAPYGYTPFCDSRTEMDGFRFWKTGYWRNHLQGRKYHISALYVVDLKRFRRIAAGDRLRGQYQALSQDPNSLSNLDQDLPNNMIHQVAIKSLPQEWLWCETWCDDTSKVRAKTIDLCNNPMTKEAKLTAAVRIVPEWTEYDEEIKRLQQRVQKGYYTQEEDGGSPSNKKEDVQEHDQHIEL